MNNQQQLKEVFKQDCDFESQRNYDNVSIDLTVNKRNDSNKKIFVYFKDQEPAKFSDVVKLDYLRRKHKQEGKNYEYVIYCTLPYNPFAEETAKEKNISYLKDYETLESTISDYLKS